MLYIALYVKFAKPDSTGGTPAGGIVGIVWIYIYAFGWYVCVLSMAHRALSREAY